MQRRIGLIKVLALALAGCGGGGGDVDVTQAAALQGTTNISDPARLPVTGRASYDGYMQMQLPTGPEGARLEYLGDLALEVNFAAAFDQIRGTAQRFEAKDRTPLAGQLSITKGNIYTATDPDAAYTFDGDVAGTLSGDPGQYVIDASIEGDFLGRNQDAVSGLVFGDITGPEGLEIFDGTFAGTRRAD